MPEKISLYCTRCRKPFEPFRDKWDTLVVNFCRDCNRRRLHGSSLVGKDTYCRRCGAVLEKSRRVTKSGRVYYTSAQKKECPRCKTLPPLLPEVRRSLPRKSYPAAIDKNTAVSGTYLLEKDSLRIRNLCRGRDLVILFKDKEVPRWFSKQFAGINPGPLTAVFEPIEPKGCPEPSPDQRGKS